MAVDQLVALYPEKKDSWLDRCKRRLFDVEYLGRETKGRRIRDVFKVYKNPKIDKAPGRMKYYKVYLYGRLENWCSCYLVSMKKAGFSQAIKVCTHVGACVLFQEYLRAMRGVRVDITA